MFEYARSDTHFLLYIFDNLRNELLKKTEGSDELVNAVMEESKTVALQRYERPFYDSERGMGDKGWYFLLIKTPALFNKEQFSIFRAVHKWRDEIARKEDESLYYIMPNNTIYNVAREMPMQIPKLLGCLSKVSDPVRRRLSELLEVVKKAKMGGSQGPEMKDFLRDHPSNIEYQARKAALREARAAITKQPSLAEVAQREIFDVPSDKLMMEKSHFWGSTVNGHKRQRLNGSETSELPALRLHVPLPNFTAEVYAVGGEGKVEAPKPPILPEHPYTKPRKSVDDEVFTLRQTGSSKKRKLAEQADAEPELSETPAEAPADDIIDLAPEPKQEQDTNKSSPEQRRAKKREKNRRKRKEKADELEARIGKSQYGTKDGDGDVEEGELSPFDYANAAPVLHAKQVRAYKGQSPAFNPYAKSLDTPKGLPHKKKELQGKSATFKS